MKIVIVQTAFIGDVILCTPMIETLYQYGHELGFIVKPEAANILENDSRISHLHIYDKRGKDQGVRGIVTMIRSLKKIQYDAAIIPHRSLRSALVVAIAGIPVRVGFTTSAGKWFLSEKTAYEKTAHEINRNQSLLIPLGINDNPPNPSIAFSNREREYVQDFFNRRQITNHDTVIGFGPGSQWLTKQWGIEHFKKLAGLLTGQYDCTIICFGSPDERDDLEEICGKFPGSIFNAAGVFDLKQSAAALERTRVVVTNDNGLMHLAVASGVPVIAIFGPTVPEFGFAPWGKHHTVLGSDLYCRPCSIHGSNTCPEKHFKCMNEITPEIVLKSIETYIT